MVESVARQQKLNIEKHQKVYNIEQAKRHITLLHNNRKGKIAIATIDDDENFKQKFYTSKTLVNKMESYANQTDVFISQNSFYRNSRKLRITKKSWKC